MIETNLGVRTVLKISHKISRGGITKNYPPEDYSSDDLIYFKCAPIPSVDVEREFLGVGKRVSRYPTIVRI